MSIGVGEELGWRDGGHPELFDAEPREFEVARSVGYVRREGVVGGQFDFGEVD